MTFSIDPGGITRCTGGNHVRMTGSINGEATTVDFTAEELLASPETPEEKRRAAIQRMRSAVKEANATTPAQIRNALEAKTFKI
jgi:hypothetical protein